MPLFVYFLMRHQNATVPLRPIVLGTVRVAKLTGFGKICPRSFSKFSPYSSMPYCFWLNERRIFNSSICSFFAVALNVLWAKTELPLTL